MKHLTFLVKLEKHLGDAILHVAAARQALAVEARVKQTQQFLDAIAVKMTIIAEGIAETQSTASEKEVQGTLFDQPVYEEEPETADVA